MDTLLSKPTIHWGPLLLVLAGVAQYVYRKYLNPISEQTIDELDEKDFLGGFGYRPEAGYVGIFFGILGFLLVNWSVIFK